MDILKVAMTSVFSAAAMFLLTRIIGRRQMSQLSLFDYVVGITIGSIAAEMATNVELDFWLPLTAMTVYTAVTIAVSYINNHSLLLRGLLLGKPVVLYDSGTLYYRNLKKVKMDLSEFLMMCRNNGYFDLSQLRLAVIEANGRVSFLPLENERPVTPSDENLSLPKKRAPIHVIMDGVTLDGCLKASGNDHNWLDKQLKLKGFDSPKDVFLATVDDGNVLTIHERNESEDRLPLFD